MSSGCEEQQKNVSNVGESYKDFIAGTVAGCAGFLVGQPFDTVKVRVQTQRRTLGVIATFLSTIRKERIYGLYRGMSAPLITDAATNSVVFGCFGLAMRSIYSGKERTQLSLTESYICGLLAGVPAALILSPVELIKIRLQLQTGIGKENMYSGPINVISQTLRSEGIRGMFRGLSATLIRDVPSFGIYFASYDGFTSLFSEQFELSKGMSSVLAGGLSGVATWLVTYPADIIKSRMQMQHHKTPLTHRYRSLSHCVCQSYQQEGASVFFRGLSPTLLRAFPVNAALFGAYELTLSLLG